LLAYSDVTRWWIFATTTADHDLARLTDARRSALGAHRGLSGRR